ncbi:MAG TPA: POTRA domain-containing protein [Caulobacteraceae bacterium]|nr:POTRA domain-containing protein [Caulobacteraceae bacterium]
MLVWAASAAVAVAAPLSHNDPTQALPPPPPAPAPGLGLPAAPIPLARQDKSVRLILAGVKFNGAVAVPEARLQPAWADLRGKSVSLADLRAIGRRAEAIYAGAGYPFVAVVLGVQEVRNGIVNYDVVEGRISDLTVLGSNLAARRQATAAFQPIVNRSPLPLSDVETAYQLAKLVPGLSISGTLRRGSQPGGMDLVIDAQRPIEWRTYVNVNNLYADPVGPWGVLFGADYFGPTKYGDEASAQVYTSAPVGRQVLVRASYMQRLNASGTAVTVSGLWGNANPKGSLSPLAIAEDVTTLRAEVSQPLLERPNSDLLADLGLEGTNQVTKVFTNIGLSDDDLRVLDFTFSGEHRHALGRLAFSAEIRRGVDIAGASRPGERNLSRFGGDPQATVLRFNAEVETATFKHLRLVARLNSQYSGQRLTEPDEYSVGNLTIGRGYQPGAALGDNALGGSAELRVGPFGVAKNLHAEPFAFYDVVSLWNDGPPPVLPYAHRTLSSVGGGVRFQFEGKAHMDLLCAIPLVSPVGLGEPRPSPTVLVNLTIGLNDAFAAIHQRLAGNSK